MSKTKIDFKSIHFKLLIYFSLFALVIIFLIGGMEVFLFNNFYGTMKQRDTLNLADTIKREYARRSDQDNFDMDTFVEYYSAQNDVSILIMRRNGDILERVTGSSLGTGPYSVISEDINPALWNIYEELVTDEDENSGRTFGLRRRAAKMTGEGIGGRNVLAYACYLNDSISQDEAGDVTGSADPEENEGSGYGSQFFTAPSYDHYIMFILAPLYPTTSTIRILTNILITIFGFALSLVLIMALYLSRRISKPIKDITRSAEEMGKGNYDVKFEAGHYSEVSELSETLTKAEREMKKTDQYQKDLIANVSHDIRTPLTMIKSYAEMIHDISGDDPEKRNKHLGIIMEETDRLNLLVNDMLDLSRLQSRKLGLEKSRFDLAEVARDVLSTYDILKESEGYDISLNAPGSVFVEADEAKIRQVINNLMTNAVKYCGEDKVIICDLKMIGNKVSFEVSDHGQGISEDELPHVWDKYYKSSTHHVRETTGSGLGLSIVKEILKMHDAEYGVISKVGKGSTFWFALPITK